MCRSGVVFCKLDLFVLEIGGKISKITVKIWH